MNTATTPIPILPVSKGFTVTHFESPYPVELFPQSGSFNPVRGLAVGEELDNRFGSKRLIVKPTTPVTRHVTNQECHWPGNVLYVWARDVAGWKT